MAQNEPALLNIDIWTDWSYIEVMASGRPQEFDSNKVIWAAMDTFWSNGFDGTSMQQLLKSTGLSKSSLYQTFGGKQELFIRCLEEYTLAMKEKLLTQLSLSKSGIGFIREVLLSAAEEAKASSIPKGCLIMNTATEFAQSNAAVSRAVNKGIEAFRTVFLTALKKARSAKEIDADADLDQLSSYVVSSMSGIKSMVKGGVDEKAVRSIVDIVMRSLS
ncbi:MAG: TetR/AcrR family transcriptional regulator [Bdellovibrionales bacterium]|nr:TetR/AcrR family transcriptional regulator [Bdellovibrionales bacterium]